jgi:hypothetical protein
VASTRPVVALPPRPPLPPGGDRSTGRNASHSDCPGFVRVLESSKGPSGESRPAICLIPLDQGPLADPQLPRFPGFDSHPLPPQPPHRPGVPRAPVLYLCLHTARVRTLPTMKSMSPPRSGLGPSSCRERQLHRMNIVPAQIVEVRLVVQQRWTAPQCESLKRDTGGVHYQLVCIFPDAISVGGYEGAAPPRNSGW